MHDELRNTLLLHIGMGKTGSTALQVGFVKSRDELLRQGVLYPTHRTDGLAARDGVVSGNGVDLARFLVPRLAPGDAPIEAMLEPLLAPLAQADGQCVLYSSEFMYGFDRTRLRALVDGAASVGLSTRVVLYLRNLAGHAYSAYSQQVKRARYTGTFLEFIDAEHGGKYRPGFRGRLRDLHGIVGPERVSLIHYDSVRDRLLTHFSEQVLGIEMAPDTDRVERRINRSLTIFELDVMRRLNSLATPQRGVARVSDALIAMPPVDDIVPVITPLELDLLNTRFEDVVGWVNSLGVDEGELAVMSDDVRVGERPETMLNAREGFLVDLVSQVFAGA